MTDKARIAPAHGLKAKSSVRCQVLPPVLRRWGPGRDASLTGARQERSDLGASGWRGVSDGDSTAICKLGEEGPGGR